MTQNGAKVATSSEKGIQIRVFLILKQEICYNKFVEEINSPQFIL
jgi:hypothetical protein